MIQAISKKKPVIYKLYISSDRRVEGKLNGRIQITGADGMSNIVQMQSITNIRQTATGTEFDLTNGKTVVTTLPFTDVYTVTKNNEMTFTAMSHLISLLPVVV